MSVYHLSYCLQSLLLLLVKKKCTETPRIPIARPPSVQFFLDQLICCLRLPVYQLFKFIHTGLPTIDQTLMKTYKTV